MKRTVETNLGTTVIESDGAHPEWEAEIDRAIAEGKPIIVSEEGQPPSGEIEEGAVLIEVK